MLNWILLQLLFLSSSWANPPVYTPRGVGGGGAMAGYSISPYSDLRFVGTDMGTLFRSTDQGKSWSPVSHAQVTYNSNLELAADVGFSANPKVVFFADAGRAPKRSKDAGITWFTISVPLNEEERIRYWKGDSEDPKRIFCGTTEGLLVSTNQGDSWTRVTGVEGVSQGTAIVSQKGKRRIYHANEAGIFLSEDHGKTFRKWFSRAGTRIRAFAGGADAHGLTLAFIDGQGKEACAWAAQARDVTSEQKSATYQDCGFVWIHRGEGTEPLFKNTKKEGGRFIRMAENDSRTIYLTGGDWARQYGSKIWVSRNGGESWKLKFNVYDWDSHPYQPWPKDRLEYSAVGVDVGWNDNAPFSFAVNARNSSEAGGTGHYFLHVTRDFGEHWLAPFSQFADQGERAKGKRWKSTGLEMTSVLRLKFHPKNPKLGYASIADIGGYVTEDGGSTWRISKAKYNTNYDYAFDPSRPDRVYAASGDRHDFPLNINTPIVSQGGIFVTNDRGKSWKRLTPESGPFQRQFLSVAYDPIHKILYGGTQGGGVARSKNEGKTWEYFNVGLSSGELVIPQIEIDPKDGTAYALLTGEAPEFGNADQTGIYRLSQPKAASPRWELLRGNVKRPPGVEPQHSLWLFPSAFAIDFSRPKRDVLWLSDIENKGAWLASGVWKSIDSGKNWTRMTQFTHPTAITIDPNDSRRVHVSGLYTMTGKWGSGGAIYTLDGGTTWKKNDKLPLLANLFNFTPDPNHSENGFYTFFGGGILYGPKPK